MQGDSLEQDPLMVRAKALVQTAREVGTGSYAPMLDQFPSLEPALAKKRAEGYWDFLVAIACIYIAAARLQNMQLGKEREEPLLVEVSASMHEWDAVNARAAFENCKEFFGHNFEMFSARGDDPRYITSDAIGGWIAWNLFGHAPETDDEAQFMRRIGVGITHGFFGWWDAVAEVPEAPPETLQ